MNTQYLLINRCGPGLLRLGKRLVLALVLTLGMITGAPAADDLLGAFTEGELNGQVKTFFMRTNLSSLDRPEAMAIGGKLHYETSPLYGINAGATFFTSNGLIFHDPTDYTNLLAPGQKNYNVLGEAYLQGVFKNTGVKLFRQAMDTPFINQDEIRMTPRTFEAYTLTNKDIPNTQVIVSQVTKMKYYNDTTFKDMSLLPNTEEPVTMAGIYYGPLPDLNIQLWDYFAHQFMNIAYFQADYSYKLNEIWTLTGGAQYGDERDVGRAIWGPIQTRMYGLRAGVKAYGAELTFAVTSNDDAHPFLNLWGGYPGFNSVIVNDGNLAGEDAWSVTLGYDFSTIGLPGLTAFGTYADYRTSVKGRWATPDTTETDLTVEYKFDGMLKGLGVKFQGISITQDDKLGGEDYTDFRAIMYYDFKIFEGGKYVFGKH
ncbi:MAG: outer membrane porin, OprD family [Deltaproteobacteria bacterium]|nr:outer membrane porin, OprD family [Deltaproteobacteria bacterium]